MTISRRDVLKQVAAGASLAMIPGATSLAAEEISKAALQKIPAWLPPLHEPPKDFPANPPILLPLLVSGEGKPITTREAWELKRDAYRQAWRKLLGSIERDAKSPPKLTVLKEDRASGCVRKLVSYEVEPGIATEAYWIVPEKIDKKLPAIVVFHSTVDHSIAQPAGLAGPEEKWFGLRYAQQGYATFSPRNFLWPTSEKIDAKTEAEKFLKRRASCLGMAKMLHDAQVAVDLVSAQPEVDATRIGAIGHSLGAKEVLYLAAFDDRIRATISSEGGIGKAFSNWEAPWYLGPIAKDEKFYHDHHELLACAAPRPFLLVAGESADSDRGWPMVDKAREVYELYQQPAPVAQLNHRAGHAVPPDMLPKFDEWFATFL
jgi:dienelactone hydrolase